MTYVVVQVSHKENQMSHTQMLKLLARNVKKLRSRLDISQEVLAMNADIDRTYVSQIERAIGNPSVLILVKISNALHVDVPYLFSKH